MERARDKTMVLLRLVRRIYSVGISSAGELYDLYARLQYTTRARVPYYNTLKVAIGCVCIPTSSLFLCPVDVGVCACRSLAFVVGRQEYCDSRRSVGPDNDVGERPPLSVALGHSQSTSAVNLMVPPWLAVSI